VAAGVLAGASVVIPSTAAAATSGGIFSKLGSLPLTLKLGASAVVAGAAALPVYQGISSSNEVVPPPAVVAAAVTARPGSSVPKLAENPSVELRPEVPPAAAAEGAPTAFAPAHERAVARPQALQARSSGAPGARPAPEQAASERAVGTFPVVGGAPESAPVDEGTLRAETVLMERALTALGRGDFTTADRELTAHAARFPNGHLRRERERALERLRGKETER
jgi:hypothetical protein